MYTGNKIPTKKSALKKPTADNSTLAQTDGVMSAASKGDDYSQSANKYRTPGRSKLR